MDNLLKLLYLKQCTHNATAGAVVLQRPEQLPKLNPLTSAQECSPEAVIQLKKDTFEMDCVNASVGDHVVKKRRSMRNQPPPPPPLPPSPLPPPPAAASDANAMTGLNSISRAGLERVHVFCRNHAMRALVYNGINRYYGKTTWTSMKTQKTFNDLTLPQLEVSRFLLSFVLLFFCSFVLLFSCCIFVLC